MPMTCTVCNSQRKKEIDTALLGDGRLGSLRDIAKRYNVSLAAVHRHLHNCLPGIREDMREAMAKSEARSVLDQMAELHQRTLVLLDKAEASGDLHIALRAVREARGNLIVLGRLDGNLANPTAAPTSGPVNVTITYVDRQLNVVGAPPMLEGETD